MRVLIALLVAGAGLSPASAGAAPAGVAPPGEPAIRSITLTPATPVVGPSGTVRLVIEVVARGVADPAGVTIEVEPGVPPGTRARPVSARDPGSVADRIPGPPAYVTISGAAGAGLSTPVGRPAGGTPAPGTGPQAGWGWETWRFLPDKALTRWYPAGRWTVTATARGAGGATVTGHAAFWLRRETRFGALRVARKGAGTVRVEGVLNRVDPQGYLDYAPFAERPVDILCRTAKEGEWERVATVVTDVRGRFAHSLPDPGAGEWRARFAQTPHYAGRLSAVRRLSP